MYEGKRPIEDQIEANYANHVAPFVGNLSAAREWAKQAIQKCIEESKCDHTYNLPANFAEIVLGHADDHDPSRKELVAALRANLPAKREDGVTDEDVRWWWGLDDIERRMMLQLDEFFRTAMFIDQLEKHSTLPQQEAADTAGRAVHRYHPRYGNPASPDLLRDKMGFQEDDRPLPFELKDRVNRYVVRRTVMNHEKYRRDIEASTSFNALVRREIRAGRLGRYFNESAGSAQVTEQQPSSTLDDFDARHPDWDVYNDPSGQKQPGRYLTDYLVCTNAACLSRGNTISEREAFYVFARQPIWKRMKGLTNLYVCPVCGGRDLIPEPGESHEKAG